MIRLYISAELDEDDNTIRDEIIRCDDSSGEVDCYEDLETDIDSSARLDEYAVQESSSRSGRIKPDRHFLWRDEIKPDAI